MLSKYKNLVSVGIILCMYFFLHISVFKMIKSIPNTVFNESFSYFSSSLMNIPTMLLFFLFTLFFTVNFKKFQWGNFENSKIIKVFVLILAGAIFWEQGFYLDKIIFFYNPVFVSKSFDLAI